MARAARRSRLLDLGQASRCRSGVPCLTATEGRARRGAAGAAATAQAAAPSYARHVPERTLLYTLVQAHYPDFIARLGAEERYSHRLRSCASMRVMPGLIRQGGCGSTAAPGRRPASRDWQSHGHIATACSRATV
ncbi:MAG: hypothetical protein ABL934_10435 [Lysobacteraceae bacterium]